MDIQELNIEEYLKKFKVFLPETLFPPQWIALKEKRCPLCTCKLHLPRKNHKIVYCNSKKHGKPFVITFKTYSEIIKSLESYPQKDLNNKTA